MHYGAAGRRDHRGKAGCRPTCGRSEPVSYPEDGAVQLQVDVEIILALLGIEVAPAGQQAPTVAEVILDVAKQLPGKIGPHPKSSHVPIDHSAPFSAQRGADALRDDGTELGLLAVAMKGLQRAAQIKIDLDRRDPSAGE